MRYRNEAGLNLSGFVEALFLQGIPATPLTAPRLDLGGARMEYAFPLCFSASLAICLSPGFNGVIHPLYSIAPQR